MRKTHTGRERASESGHLIINEPKMSPSPLHFCDVIFVLSVRLSSAHPFGFGSVPIFSRTRAPHERERANFVVSFEYYAPDATTIHLPLLSESPGQTRPNSVQWQDGFSRLLKVSVRNHIWSSTKIKSSLTKMKS